MKKNILKILISILLAITITGCAREASPSDISEEASVHTVSYESIETPPDNPVILIGDAMLSSDASSELKPELDYAEIKEENDKKYEGTKKSLNIKGANIEGKYSSTKVDSRNKEASLTYHVSNKVRFYLNEKGELLGFMMHEFPEGYEVRTEEVTYDEAVEIAFDFLKNTMKAGNLDEYKDKELYYEGDSAYYIYLHRYVNDICIHSHILFVDFSGNIFCYITSDTDRWGNQKVPNWDDEVYIEAAKARVVEYYAENYPDKKIKEIKDCEIGNFGKWMRYLESENTNAIEYPMQGTIVFEDGTESTFFNYFYYLLDGSSKVVREN